MMRKLLNISCVVALVFVLAGCVAPPINVITQVSTIDALLAGGYDGQMTLEALRKYGDFGIGTFEALDGEMVLLDGAFYKVRADGHVYHPPMSEQTPFACVTKFAPDHKEVLKELPNMKALEAKIDTIAPQQNRFCAFIVRGEFRLVKTRSVPAQKKPYPPLAEVTKTQPVFNMSNVRGTLIGFRCPPFVKGVNVPGYHMHFLADDLSGGGHVLEVELKEGVLDTDTVHEWLNICFPRQSEYFDSADLTKDRSAELQAVEMGKEKE